MKIETGLELVDNTIGRAMADEMIYPACFDQEARIQLRIRRRAIASLATKLDDAKTSASIQ